MKQASQQEGREVASLFHLEGGRGIEGEGGDAIRSPEGERASEELLTTTAGRPEVERC